MLLTAGAHVPVIPFVEVVGNTGAAAPLQIAGTALNVGVILELTVTVAFAVAGQPQEFVTVNE